MQAVERPAVFPSVSVVISTLNRVELLEKTLKSLEFQNYPGFEVVVVNGPSTDATAAFCRNYQGSIVYAEIDIANLSKSRNAGICLSSGEIILFLDDDAFAEPNWIANIVSGFDSHMVGGVGTRVYDHTGFRWQENPFLIDKYYEPVFDRTPPLWAFEYPDSQTIPHILGASSSFRREALIKVGGFDEEIEYFLDESEICRRVVELGYKIRFVDSGASVHHQFAAGVTRDERRLLTHPYPVVKNKYYVCLSDCRRHRGDPAEYVAACDAWCSALTDDAKSQFADKKISRAEYQSFMSDVARGAADGRVRATGQVRKSITIAPTGATKPVRFALSAPEGGRKTFCFISRSIPRHAANGVSRYMWDLASGFARRGHETHLITMTDGPSTIEFAAGLWIRHLSRSEFTAPGANALIGDAASPLRSSAARANTTWSKAAHGEVLRLRRDRYIDRVIAPVWDQEGLYCALDRRLDTVISMNTTFHRYADIEGHKIDVLTRAELLDLESFYIRTARYFLSNSSASSAHLAQDFMLDCQAMIAHAPHGVDDIDPDARLRIIAKQAKPARFVRVLYVSRLERRKGADIFLAVAIETLKQHTDVIFEMVGRDSYPDNSEQGYAQYFDALAPEMGKRFIRHGEVTDEKLRALYEQADIFFVPSRYESFGIIFVEAMRCYLPVLTIDVGGARDVVEHGVTGLLADSDDCAVLVDLLNQLILDPVRRTQMGVAGRERYERLYTNESVVDATIEALKFPHVAP